MEPVAFTVLFQRPVSWIGRIVTFVTGDEYSHSVVSMRGRVWSSQIPKVATWAFADSPYKSKITNYDSHTIMLTSRQADLVESWLNGRVGSWYDVLALVGWLFGITQLQWRNRFYCHEFCREPLEKIGLLADVDELITARQLMNDLETIRNRQ